MLAAGPATGEVRIEIAASGHAVVPVEGGFGVRMFVFDTGAEGSAVYAGFAEEAHLPVVGSEMLQGQTGEANTELVRFDKLTLDGVVKGPIDAVLLEARSDGVPLAGIVGLDVFGDRLVDFDLPRGRLVLRDSGQQLVSGQGLAAVPTAGNLLTIPVKIGSITATAVIDTGARKTRINWTLGDLLGIDRATISRGDTISGATNMEIEAGAAHVTQVHLGPVILRKAPVLVADLPVFEAFGVSGKPAIILGLDWLTETRLVVDFPARLVWFQSRH